MIKIKSNRNENLLLSATITHKLFDQVLFLTYQEAEVPVQGAKNQMKMIFVQGLSKINYSLTLVEMYFIVLIN
jgi:hypothetical protein